MKLVYLNEFSALEYYLLYILDISLLEISGHVYKFVNIIAPLIRR